MTKIQKPKQQQVRRQRKRSFYTTTQQFLPIAFTSATIFILYYFARVSWLNSSEREEPVGGQNDMIKAEKTVVKPKNESWIPQKDIDHYFSQVKQKQQKQQTSSQENRSETQKNNTRYVPNLNQYPLTLLHNISYSPEEGRRKEKVMIPFFWHVPKAAGTTIKNVMTLCYGLTRAQLLEGPQSLKLIKGILNMDTHTVSGITASKKAGIIPNNHANAIVSSLLHEASTLFTPDQNGQLFTIIRHPIHTSASLFYYLSYAKWEKYYNPKLANMTLAEYASSKEKGITMVDNWMVRYLSHEEHGEITSWHLKFAKDLLERKCIIGLFDHLQESIHRFQYYFGWDNSNDDADLSSGGTSNRTKTATRQCVCDRVQHHDNKHQHAKVVEGSDDWNILLKKNKYDVQLYEFAVDLYERQGRTIFAKLLEKDGEEKDDASFCSPPS